MDQSPRKIAGVDPATAGDKGASANKERLLSEIADTRSQMDATVGALEEKLSPARLKEQLLEQFHEVKEVIKHDLKEELKVAKHDLKEEFQEAKTAVALELKNQFEVAKTAVSAELKEQLEGAKDAVKENLSEAKDAVKKEIQEAKSAVRKATIGRVEDMVSSAENTVKNTTTSVIDTIRDNPIPAALAGIGLAWLFMNGRSSKRGFNAGQPWSPSMSGGRFQDGAHRIGHEAENALHKTEALGSEIADKVKQTSTDIASKVKETSTELATKVRDTANQVKQSTVELKDQAQVAIGEFAHKVEDKAGQWVESTRRFENRVEESVRQNPLVYGAVALALGTAIGASIPRSRIEDEYLGSASDQLAEKAESVAHEALDHLAQGSGAPDAKDQQRRI